MFALGIVIAAIGCADGAVQPQLDEVSYIEPASPSISFNKEPSGAVDELNQPLAVLEPGATVQLYAYNSSGRTLDATWSTSNKAVATVSSSGLVTGAGAGTAAIGARTRGKTVFAQITVIASNEAPSDTASDAPPTQPDTTSEAGLREDAVFVSTTGSDGAAGTKSSPWRSVGRALTRLEPGQTLYVRGGTYTENITNPTIRPGRPDARITVAAYPGERPVLRGLLWLKGASYWTLDGINVTWATGNDATDHMVKMTDGVGWVVENAELWGARSFAGLLVYGSGAGEPADWTVRGNCIHDVWTDPIHHTNGDHNLYINTGTSAGAGLIERNILFNAPNGQNIKLGYGRSDPQPGDGAANVTVRYNTMYDALKNLMVADESHSITIERNIIQSSDEDYAIRAYRLTGANNVFRDNIFYDFSRLQFGDSGYRLVADGGGNLFPHDPEFDGLGCHALRPTDSVALAYGRYGR